MRSSVWLGFVFLAVACVSPQSGTDRGDRSGGRGGDAGGGSSVQGSGGGDGSTADLFVPDAPGEAIATDSATQASCGNGQVEPGETCDPPGSCPTSCAGNGCSRFTLKGTASACTARCVESMPQNTCVAGDGCCPLGCTSGNDGDCAITCGPADGFCPASCTAAADPDCKKATGQSCTAGAECVTGHCASGLCCNRACTETCSSCAAIHTGGTNGACAPVKAGADPGDDCAASPPGSCGDDGQCDGAGKCRRFGATTTCAEATCANSLATPAGHCNGQGSCTVPAAASCKEYTCSASTLMCRKTCSTDPDCTASNHCEGTACVAKCRTQGAQNLIPNAGFDSKGWNVRDAGMWDFREDGVGCSTSGAMRIDESFRPQMYSDCFAVAPGKRYSFGYLAKGRPSESQQASCSVRWWMGSDCSGESGTPYTLSTQLTASWQRVYGEVTSPADAHGADVYCGVPTYPTAWFDLFYLNASGAKF